MTHSINTDVADRLDELAALVGAQGGSSYRVNAYRRAAASVRRTGEPVSDILHRQGIDGLKTIPGVGDSIARAIRDLVVYGRLAMLDRVRGHGDPVKVLASVPGIGAVLADRLHHDLGIETLEELEEAAHGGRLRRAGIGEKRLAGIRDSLAHRLARVHRLVPPHTRGPALAEILDVDREYRERAAQGTLARIAPRRFNPRRIAWLPILHTERDGRHYTALFSNTARAHRLGRTDDWVVIYWDDGEGEGRCTVITARGRAGLDRRIVRGYDPADPVRAEGESATGSPLPP
jgi:DNA polymerase (family X)